MDLSLDTLLKQLPLSDEIKGALIERQGPYGCLLSLGECFEMADWKGVEHHRMRLGLSQNAVFSALADASAGVKKCSR